MKIRISGVEQEFDIISNVSELLTRIGIDPTKNGVAIAKNGSVIPKRLWQEAQVLDGDAIEIVRASQGG